MVFRGHSFILPLDFFDIVWKVDLLAIIPIINLIIYDHSIAILLLLHSYYQSTRYVRYQIYGSRISYTRVALLEYTGLLTLGPQYTYNTCN